MKGDPMSGNNLEPLYTESALWATALKAAVSTLEEQMTCGNPVIEVRAANAILRFNHKMKEKDLEERLAVLEKSIRPFRG